MAKEQNENNSKQSHIILMEQYNIIAIKNVINI